MFEDFTEMIHYLFDYFGLEPGQEKEKGMAGLLGERLDQKPLSIEDITRFWLLREGPVPERTVESNYAELRSLSPSCITSGA